MNFMIVIALAFAIASGILAFLKEMSYANYLILVAIFFVVIAAHFTARIG
jgi:hypothetical protein